MKSQQLYSYIRRACQDFNLISDGDHIAVGISGGKDSMALLYGLKGLSRFYPASFKLSAISVDLGFDNQDMEKIKVFCNEFGIPLNIVKTDIGDIVFQRRNESNPCSLCAKMRKGALNQKALELGCNKVAYAHHKNDIIETMMLSLIYEGRFNCFKPKTYLDRTGITVIRPLMYVNEKDIIGFTNKYEIPVAKSVCPADGNTKREHVKNLIKNLEHENPGCSERLFHAVLNMYNS